jgi:hypothetical protein
VSREGPDAVGARRRAVLGLVVVAVFLVCLINAVIAVEFTRRLDGPQPGDLEERYGGLREELADVVRVAYISGDRWRFLNARYALAPTSLDPGFVDLDLDERTIVGFDLEGLAGHAAANPPLLVLCDFGNRLALTAFVDDLAAEIEMAGLELEVVDGGDGLALLSVGD